MTNGAQQGWLWVRKALLFREQCHVNLLNLICIRQACTDKHRRVRKPIRVMKNNTLHAVCRELLFLLLGGGAISKTMSFERQKKAKNESKYLMDVGDVRGSKTFFPKRNEPLLLPFGVFGLLFWTLPLHTGLLLPLAALCFLRLDCSFSWSCQKHHVKRRFKKN